jgi:hypothetical protein
VHAASVHLSGISADSDLFKLGHSVAGRDNTAVCCLGRDFVPVWNFCGSRSA